MNVRFEDINPTNRSKVESLEVHEWQLKFLPDIKPSLELGSKYSDAHAQAIYYNKNNIVGYFLYGIDEESSQWKIFRLMIDKQWQGKGIGEFALVKLISKLKIERGAREVLITYSQDNTVAGSLYSKLGFVQYGVKGNRILAKYVFKTQI